MSGFGKVEYDVDEDRANMQVSESWDVESCTWL